MCCSYTYLNLDTAVNFEGKLQQLASCCITDNESLHCCCRLPNTFASCWTFSMPYNWPGDAPLWKNCPFPWGRSGHQPHAWFLGPAWVHTSNSTWIHTQMAELVKVVFGLWTVNGPRNHGRGPYILWEGQFWGVILGHAQTCVWSIFSTLFSWGKRAYGYHSTIATCCS